MQRSSRCFAEPGPRLELKKAGPRLCSAPLREELRHSASKTRVNALMALRPGNVLVGRLRRDDVTALLPPHPRSYMPFYIASGPCAWRVHFPALSCKDAAERS